MGDRRPLRGRARPVAMQRSPSGSNQWCLRWLTLQDRVDRAVGRAVDLERAPAGCLKGVATMGLREPD
ncbi:MAG: hypothetical protein AAGG06_00670, partial [Pseudomonadota bacterium]